VISTGIIGPNGGGKSTILEALNFVMLEDIRMRSIRYKFYDFASNFNSDSETKKNKKSKKRNKITVELVLKIMDNNVDHSV
jgi:AAA15 family ATPase/GTPase